MFARAEQLIVERRYEEAITFCQLQLAASPRCVTLRLWLARALSLNGSATAAATQLQECLRIDPSCAAARAMLAAQPARAMAAAPPPSVVSLLDEEADRPTNPRRGRRPTPSAAPVERPQPRPVAVERPQPRPQPVAVQRPRPVEVVPLRPVIVASPRPAAVAQARPIAAAPSRAAAVAVAHEPAVVIELERPIAVAHNHPVAVAHEHPVAIARSRPRPRRRQTFASPFVDAPKAPTGAAARWERPMRIEGQRPQPLFRIGLVAITIAGLLALWRLGRDDRSPMPAASLAAASLATATATAHPQPEPPVVKADSAPFDVLGTDVWIHPLAGPARRMPIRDSRLFGAERYGDRPQECRGGHCGIDLAGDYGEPVYAVHEGVIDRVQREANPQHGGHYVRIMHRGGTITTQYFHLSEIPRRLEAGVTVKAGDVVGFVGLTGVRHSEPHLHFTISVQEPSGADGRYLDPEPLVALWPLRVSQKGDERLHISSAAPPGLARGFIRRSHHRHHARPAPPPDDDATAAD
ncbi:MAG: peptidoglycan DD-metalloendopeptidase family protein [Polyangia bacterium]